MPKPKNRTHPYQPRDLRKQLKITGDGIVNYVPSDVTCHSCGVDSEQRTAQNRGWSCFLGIWWCEKHDAAVSRMVQRYDETKSTALDSLDGWPNFRKEDL